MKRISIITSVLLLLLTGCEMKNPLLQDSTAPFGAPEFNKIKNEHYLPAITQAIEEAKAEIDAIVANEDAPTFENTIEALEYSGMRLNSILSIFYNVMEANTSDEMQAIAEELSPILNEYSMYVSLNKDLFKKIKTVYDSRDTLGLESDQMRLLEQSYNTFASNGANLPDEKKEEFAKLSEELSLAGLKFSKNVLASRNAYCLNITDSADLAGLPPYVVEAAAETAASKSMEGWAFTLDYPSYGPFMKFSDNRELRKQMYMAYNTVSTEGENSNMDIVKQIIDLRIKKSNMLGYTTFADYALENRMAKNPETVNKFISQLLVPSIPFAKAEVDEILEYAKATNPEYKEIMPWDFSYWSEKYRSAKYSINEEVLKPYFKLENCIDAVFALAGKLYGLTFTQRNDIPVYHEDVKVYEVNDADGRHLALFYADFFPRPSKRGGAWMTDFRGQSIVNGVEKRPFINIVTNFSKPTATTPSLITHDEFTTFLHEFGHALHGIMAEGRYPSQTGTSVARDFVELPSQIMENWAYEPEYLNSFAKHYETGEEIPAELIEKIVAAKNYLAGYSQVRQLHFAYLDMAWHSLTKVPTESAKDFEKAVLKPYQVMATVPETCTSTQFSHIFSGGYSAGYYSYKWAEVLEADAFSLFEEKGIFNTEVSHSFRQNILSKGDSEDPAVLYRKFRGHDPQPEALMKKLGLAKK